MCLHGLSPSDLASFFRDRSVERHVLRLEWRDAEPVFVEHAAQCRGQDALADARSGALDHHGAGESHVGNRRRPWVAGRMLGRTSRNR
jgi:hypothetical protein